jgi:hypothetical protein
MRRRQIQSQRNQVEQDVASDNVLPKLRAQVQTLLRQISEISAAQSYIVDPRLTSFSSQDWRCRHCNEEQAPKGLASHERWCQYNPNRGRSR